MYQVEKIQLQHNAEMLAKKEKEKHHEKINSNTKDW